MEQLNRFWRWWRAELSGLVPHTDPRLSVQRMLPLEIHLSVSGASLYRQQNLSTPLEQKKLIAEASSVTALLSGKRLKGSAVLTFDESLALRKTMPLSPQLHRDADAVIASELARTTPLRAEQIVIFWRQHLPGSIEYAVLRLADMREAERAARENGVSVSALAFRPNQQQAWLQVRSSEKALWHSRKDRRWRNIAAGLLVATVFSAGAFALARSLENTATLASVGARADQVRPGALDRRKEIDGIAAEISALSALAKSRKTELGLVPVWEELSRILPTSAWLQGMNMREGRVQIEGNAQNAEALIAALENSTLFENVKFAAPVVDQQSAGSRYVISLDIERPK
jgi:general secretion pathway protein L